jgi:hypothetical protein
MGDWEDLCESLGLTAAAQWEKVARRMGIDDDEQDDERSIRASGAPRPYDAARDSRIERPPTEESKGMNGSFSFRVAGISYCQAAASRCRVGDEVLLVPEPANRFDPQAIRVDVRGEKIGYVPREQTAALRQFNPLFQSAKASVRSVLGGSDGYLTGIDVTVDPILASEPPRQVQSTPAVELDPRQLRYVVLRKVPLQPLLMSILSRQEGTLPFPIRVDGDFIPAGTDWERFYRSDGNDMWEFLWSDSAGKHEVRFFLFTDQDCEVLFPREDGFLLDD